MISSDAVDPFPKDFQQTVMNEQIKTLLKAWFSDSSLNRLPGEYGGMPIFAEPLIGVARGDDPFKLV